MKRRFITLISLFVISCVCALSQETNVIKAYIKDGDVFIIYTNGAEKQLTFTKTDSDPFLLKAENIIVFIRKTPMRMGMNKYTSCKIVKVDIKSLIETVITDQKSFKDFEKSTNISRIKNPTLSSDQKFIFSVTEKYVTGDQLVKVELSTGAWTELFSAEEFQILTKEPYKNMFLIGRSEIDTQGRGIHYKLVDKDGKVLKEFGSEASMIQFRNSIK